MIDVSLLLSVKMLICSIVLMLFEITVINQYTVNL